MGWFAHSLSMIDRKIEILLHINMITEILLDSLAVSMYTLYLKGMTY